MVANSDEAQSFWVSVTGGKRAIMVPTTGLLNVFMALKKVKEECNVLLREVDISLLSLYQSEQKMNEKGEARSECSMLWFVCCGDFFNFPRCCFFLGSVCPLLMCCVFCRCVVVAFCCQSTIYQNHIQSTKIKEI